jgi:hypothetical protein
MKKFIRIGKPNPKKIKFIDFAIEKEPWNKIKLSDESELSYRFILSQVVSDKTMIELETELKGSNGKNIALGFGFQGSRIFSVCSPVNLRGDPDNRKYNITELRNSIIDEDLDFDTVKSSWNIYTLENRMTVKCRLWVMSISRTSKFDDLGLPIYDIESNIDLKVDLPPNIEELIKSKEKNREIS